MTNTDLASLLVLLGSVKSARAALGTHQSTIPSGALAAVPDLEERLANIDEELRKLARDISKATGV